MNIIDSTLINQPEARWLTITPLQAKEWIDRHDLNRSVRKKKVEKITRAIRDGRFKQNGETIKIAKNGRLMDGQHRLHACVQSGLPINTLVVFNLDEDVIDTVDIGTPKEAHDVLTLAGQNVSKSAVSTSRIIYQLHRQVLVDSPSLTPSEVGQFYSAYRERIDWAISVLGTKIHPGIAHTRAPLWAAFAFIHPIAPTSVVMAANLLKSGSMDDTIEALRSVLVRGQVSVRHNVQARLDASITYMRAIEAYVDGENLSRLYVRDPEAVLSRIRTRVFQGLKRQEGSGQ